MSIYATILSIQHPDEWMTELEAKGIGAGVIGDDSEERALGSPWVYHGSGHVPQATDNRRGDVSLALIPSHITRDGRDDQPEDSKPWPWLRLSVNSEDVILDVAQARAVSEALVYWLSAVEEGDPQP